MLNVKGRLTFQPFNKNFFTLFEQKFEDECNRAWKCAKTFGSLSSFRIGWSIWNLEGGIWRGKMHWDLFGNKKRIVFERDISMHNFAGNFQAEVTDFRERRTQNSKGRRRISACLTFFALHSYLTYVTSFMHVLCRKLFLILLTYKSFYRLSIFSIFSREKVLQEVAFYIKSSCAFYTQVEGLLPPMPQIMTASNTHAKVLSFIFSIKSGLQSDIDKPF